MDETRNLDNRISKVKRRRKAIPLTTKLEILKRFNNGDKAPVIASSLGMPITTIRTIHQNADKIRESADAGSSKSFEVITKARPHLIETTEKLLSTWIFDLNDKHIPVTTRIIQEKAKSLFGDLKQKASEEEIGQTFNASQGWFERFKKRFRLHSLKLTGETAGADSKAAEEFPPKFKQIILEGGYTPQQIFNVDECGLYWKRMPSKSFVAREQNAAPGFKVAKDRLTILLGGNASGDFKLKPLVIYHSENPRCMKNVPKKTLPVIWKHNKKAWMTSSIFIEWFTQYFCPAVKRYCEKLNLSHKALLVLDNAPSHPVNLDETNDQVKLIFLPANTTSLLQPMDQGVIATFKMYYLRRNFNQLIEAMDCSENGNELDSIRNFWREYNILQAVENIKKSWEEVTKSNMNKVWRKLWPECIPTECVTEESQQTHQQIIELAHRIGFTEVDVADVTELLKNNEDELSNEELIALLEDPSVDNFDQEVQVLENRNQQDISDFPLQKLSEALNYLHLASELFRKYDNDTERSESIIRSISTTVSCYRELYNEKRRNLPQGRIDYFFKPSSFTE